MPWPRFLPQFHRFFFFPAKQGCVRCGNMNRGRLKPSWALGCHLCSKTSKKAYLLTSEAEPIAYIRAINWFFLYVQQCPFALCVQRINFYKYRVNAFPRQKKFCREEAHDVNVCVFPISGNLRFTPATCKLVNTNFISLPPSMGAGFSPIRKRVLCVVRVTVYPQRVYCRCILYNDV